MSCQTVFTSALILFNYPIKKYISWVLCASFSKKKKKKKKIQENGSCNELQLFASLLLFAITHFQISNKVMSVDLILKCASAHDV